jgi:hypothetical protein
MAAMEAELIVAASLRRKGGVGAAVGGGVECLVVQNLLYHIIGMAV